MQALRGYRTIIVNVLMLVSAALVALGLAPLDVDVIANNVESVLAGVVAAVALVNMVLRLFTTGPIGAKK